MLQWRVYYGNGDTFSDKNGEPSQAPAQNVQAVAVIDREVGRFILSHWDYYWFDHDTDRWWGGDQFGMWDYLTRPGWKRVLFGRSLGNDSFNAVMRRAVNDPDLPVKTGWSPKEPGAGGVLPW
jgi:hypothetical protein